MRNLLTVLLLAAPLGALASPFGKGEADKGKPIEAKHCVGCHVRLFGTDGSGVYTRASRKIKDATSLRQRVAACNAQTSAGLFPEDEDHVAAFLNNTYYRFK